MHIIYHFHPSNNAPRLCFSNRTIESMIVTPQTSLLKVGHWWVLHLRNSVILWEFSAVSMPPQPPYPPPLASQLLFQQLQKPPTFLTMSLCSHSSDVLQPHTSSQNLWASNTSLLYVPHITIWRQSCQNPLWYALLANICPVFPLKIFKRWSIYVLQPATSPKLAL